MVLFSRVEIHVDEFDVNMILIHGIIEHLLRWFCALRFFKHILSKMWWKKGNYCYHFKM